MSNINNSKRKWRLSQLVGMGTTAWREYLDGLGFSGDSLINNTKQMLIANGSWMGNMAGSLLTMFEDTGVVPPPNNAPTIVVVALNFAQSVATSVGEIAGNYTTDKQGDNDVIVVTFNAVTTHYTLNTINQTLELTAVGVNVVANGDPLDPINLRVTDDGTPPLFNTHSDTPDVIPVPPVPHTPTIVVTANDFTQVAGASVGDVAATYVTDDLDIGNILTVTVNTASSHYTLVTGNDNVVLTQAAVDLIDTGSAIDSIDLRVTDDSIGLLTSTGSDTPFVTPAPPPPQFGYSITDNIVDFINGSGTGEWVFGDGATTNDVDPSHEYDQHGPYLVTLDGLNQIALNISAVLMPVPGIESVPGNPDSNVVTFTGTGGVSYVWTIEGSDFTDNPYIHTFAAGGDYNIILAATDSIGNTGVTSTSIAVSLPNVDPVITEVTASKDLLVVDYDVTATDDIGETLTYLWTFEDSQPSSTLKSPQVTYSTDGTYTATVVVSDDRGGSAQDTVDITVSSVPSFGPELMANPNFDNADVSDFTFSSHTYVLGSGIITLTGASSQSVVQVLNLVLTEGSTYDITVTGRNLTSNTGIIKSFKAAVPDPRMEFTGTLATETDRFVVDFTSDPAFNARIYINAGGSAGDTVELTQFSIKEVL